MAARLRAAAAYGGLTREQIRQMVGISEVQWSRLIGRKGDERAQVGAITDEQLRRLANAVDLPVAFFRVEFGRLPELVNAARLPITPELLHAARAILDLADGSEEFSEAAEEAGPQHDQQRERRERGRTVEDDRPAGP
jgi:hypothetical protein